MSRATSERQAIVPGRSLSPWQALYETAHRLRRGWSAGRANQLPRPVVSVGNLHWGGSGKTPLVASIAAWLRDRDLFAVILSRGYGAKRARRGEQTRLVSAGEGPLLGPRIAGDEPVMLAEELTGVGVVVSADRYRAGVAALERMPRPVDLFVLDDGFSHVRLHRDLDLLVLPQDDPIGGGRLPPSGRLREPLASARHADALVWSGATAEQAERLAAELGRYGFSGPGFASGTEVLPARLERGAQLPENAQVLLVTGIAKPERVRRSAEDLSYKVVEHLAFSDHHAYPDASLRRIEDSYRNAEAEWVLTTAKDHVKLLGRLEAPLAMLPVRARPHADFWSWLDGELAGLLSPGDTQPTT